MIITPLTSTIMAQQEKRVLHLTLKKKWFDMIASGEKKEEYRDINDYWIRRLHKNGSAADDEFKDFDVVRFKNGYSKNAPVIVVEIDEIVIQRGKPEWGAEPGKEYFVIKLGKHFNPLTMQQEQPQYYRAVKASERLPEITGLYFIKKDVMGEFDEKVAFWDGEYFTNGGKRKYEDEKMEWLEPIHIPDAAVLRSALEKILAIQDEEPLPHLSVLDMLVQINTIALEALSAVGDGWIRVKDKKPDLDKLIWLCWEDDKSVELGRYVSGERYMENDPVFEAETTRLGRYVEPPTHWKPYIIPSPPINK